MGAVVKTAIADAVLTSIWVFSVSTLGLFSFKTSEALGVETLPLPSLFITTLWITIFLFTAGSIGKALGGASFNPASTLSFYAAGLKPDASLTSMAVSFPAQAAAGVLGVLAILSVMPNQYQHVLGGPSLKVDLHTGAVAEAAMTFLQNFSVLFVVIKGPRNPLLQLYLISVATISVVVFGAGYTGPSLNPANAFGWAYVNSKHNTWEQFYVYWVCPLIGSTVAARLFRFLFYKPPDKQKEA